MVRPAKYEVIPDGCSSGLTPTRTYVVTREMSFADCNADVGDGCEQALKVPVHCGACGAACLEGVDCVGNGLCGDRVVQISVGTSHCWARNAEGDVIRYRTNVLLPAV